MNYAQPLLAVVCTATASLFGQHWQPIAGIPHLVEGAMAHDSARGHTVLFGGAPGLYYTSSYPTAMFRDTWLRVGGTWVRATPAHDPGGRRAPAMANDPLRQRVILFGGLSMNSPNHGEANDTWEWDGVDWREVVTAHAPTPRAYSRMVYDHARQETLLYSGNIRGSLVHDTWYFDGTDWREVVPTTPLPSGLWLNLAFCATRGQVVGIATQQNGARPVETWAFTGTTWAPVSTATVPPTFDMAMLDQDPTGGLALLIPHGQPTNTPETWRFDGTDWRLVTTAHTPPQHWTILSTFDSQRQRLVARLADDTWEFDGVDWHAAPIPDRLTRVVQPSLAWDVVRDRLVRFGGHQSEATLPGWTADHWEWDGTRWTLLPQAVAPSPRSAAPMVYDRRRRCLVLQGGFRLQDLNDTWEHDGLVWRQRQPAHPPTEPVRAMAYDPARGETIAYAATDGVQPAIAATYRYDGTDWSRITTTQVPPNRTLPAFAWDEARDCGVLFGGIGANGTYADTWEFRDGDWSRRNPQTRPNIGNGLATYDAARGRVVLTTVDFGGLLAGATWAYDGTLWTRLPVTDPIPQFIPYPMVHDPVRQRLLMFGMWSELWAYEPPPVPHWTKLGSGCAHGSGTAVLDLVPGTTPTLGGTLALRCTPLPTPPGALWTVFGFGAATWLGTPLPVDLQTLGRPDCQMWITPAGLDQLVVHGGTSAVITLTLPNTPQLAGMHVHAQTLLLDAGAASGFAGVSNAVIATPF